MLQIVGIFLKIREYMSKNIICGTEMLFMKINTDQLYYTKKYLNKSVEVGME